MKIDIETLRKTKGIGRKTLNRIIKQHYIDNEIKAFESRYIPSDKYKIDKNINLWQGDCLELMGHIPDKSVDMILADLPYGTTACSWDEVIPFEPLWSHYKRTIKDDGAIVLFGSEPFSTKLRMSNLDWYKYDWIWDKKSSSTGLHAKIMPLKNHELISVFGGGSLAYTPVMTQAKRRIDAAAVRSNGDVFGGTSVYRGYDNKGFKYPKSIIQFSNASQKGKVHPTQKPVELLEYLIKTYTDEGMLILDNTMGSGSTGVACKNTNRRFIGIELDKEYFEVAKKRIYKV